MSQAEYESSTPVSLDPTDHHYGIPLAEDGNPIFFVLPPDMQTSYEKTLERCARGWRAMGDPAFAIEAFILTYLHRQSPQLWLTEVACQLGIRRRTKTYAASAIAAVTRWMRYVAVRDAKRRGMSWPKAYVHAAESLKKTGAAGSADTMKDAYIAVKRDLDEGRGDQYFFTPKMPRGRAAQVPGGTLTLEPPPRRKHKR
jgi:hypothetical protein